MPRRKPTSKDIPQAFPWLPADNLTGKLILAMERTFGAKAPRIGQSVVDMVEAIRESRFAAAFDKLAGMHDALIAGGKPQRLLEEGCEAVREAASHLREMSAKSPELHELLRGNHVPGAKMGNERGTNRDPAWSDFILTLAEWSDDVKTLKIEIPHLLGLGTGSEPAKGLQLSDIGPFGELELMEGRLARLVELIGEAWREGRVADMKRAGKVADKAWRVVRAILAEASNILIEEPRKKGAEAVALLEAIAKVHAPGQAAGAAKAAKWGNRRVIGAKITELQAEHVREAARIVAVALHKSDLEEAGSHTAPAKAVRYPMGDIQPAAAESIPEFVTDRFWNRVQEANCRIHKLHCKDLLNIAHFWYCWPMIYANAAEGHEWSNTLPLYPSPSIMNAGKFFNGRNPEVLKRLETLRERFQQVSDMLALLAEHLGLNGQSFAAVAYACGQALPMAIHSAIVNAEAGNPEDSDDSVRFYNMHYLVEDADTGIDRRTADLISKAICEFQRIELKLRAKMGDPEGVGSDPNGSEIQDNRKTEGTSAGAGSGQESSEKRPDASQGDPDPPKDATKREPVLTDLQCRIFEELWERAMKADEITNHLEKVCRMKRDRRTVERAVAVLKKEGLVINKRGLGYFRPDAPPKPA